MSLKIPPIIFKAVLELLARLDQVNMFYFLFLIFSLAVAVGAAILSIAVGQDVSLKFQPDSLIADVGDM